MRLLLLLTYAIPAIFADGYVEEVSCSANGLTVMLNRSYPLILEWIADQTAKPVVYVYDHKTRVQCGSSLKNENGEINYNLTIPYGKTCDVHLADLEPNYRTAETTIAIENEGTPESIIINHVFCMYARSVQTIRFNEVSGSEKVVASTGGKPMPKVEMLFRSADGKTLRAAKFGDFVEFYVALSPDQAYRGISPNECMFSDREDMYSPEAKHLTFVQNNCPVLPMSEIIAPLANVNREVYFSKFKTFRFGDKSTVFVHCTVHVCLDPDDKECDRECYKRVNSNLTAERLRFRHRRSANITKEDLVNVMTIKNSLTVLDTEETKEVASHSIEQCLVAASATPFHAMIIIAVLSVLLLLSSFIAVCLACRLRKGKSDSFEVYAAYTNSSVSSRY